MAGRMSGLGFSSRGMREIGESLFVHRRGCVDDRIKVIIKRDNIIVNGFERGESFACCTKDCYSDLFDAT